MSRAVRAVIVPGNGSGDVTRANWYSWVNKVIITKYSGDLDTINGK